MFMVVLFGVGVLLVPALGGRLSALERLPLRHVWALFASLAIQIGIIELLPGDPDALYLGLHVFSYVLLGVFLVANRSIPGLWLTGLGAAMNFIVIVANGGVMPATVEALSASGQLPDATSFANSAPLADPNLGFLGDIFWIPKEVPFANVFSAGDVCIVLGAILAVHQVCGTRLFPQKARIIPTKPPDDPGPR